LFEALKESGHVLTERLYFAPRIAPIGCSMIMKNPFEAAPTQAVEKIIDRIDLSVFGLKEDSKLIEILSPMDRKAVDGVISSLSDETIATFGDYYGKDVAKQIFESLEFSAFANHIKTPEDFRRYAGKVMEVAKLHVGRDAEGKAQVPYDIGTSTRRAVADAMMLVRDDFDRDVDTVIQAMRVASPGIASTLKNIRGLIRTSEDLERVEQFTKRLSEHGFDAREVFTGRGRSSYPERQGRVALFGNQDAEEEIWDQHSRKQIKNPVRASFDAWQKILTDGKKLDDVLSIIDAAFIRGVDTDTFVDDLNRLPVEQRKKFIGSATAFAKKDIPPQFVAQNIDALGSSDFSKDGLAVFTTAEAKRRWLEYCTYLWTKDPRSVADTAHYFNEAYAAEIKTTSKKGQKIEKIKGLDKLQMFEVQEAVDEEFKGTVKLVRPNFELRSLATKTLEASINDLLRTNNFQALDEIGQKIKGAPEILAKLDQAFAATLTDGAVEEYVRREREEKYRYQHDVTDEQIIASYPIFKDSYARKVAPVTFSHAAQDRYRALFVPKESYYDDFKVEKIDAFLKLVGIPPTSEVLQPKYFELLDKYIRTYNEGYDDDGSYEDHGERYFNQLTQLGQMTGVATQFDKSKVMELYEFCIASGEKYHQKLGAIDQITGVHLDAEFIQKHLLDNRDFQAAVSLPISPDQLDRHFVKAENKTQDEYKRVYQIFGCYDYYQGILARLEKDKTRGAKQEVIAILAVMGLRDMENAERYASTKEKLMAFVEEKGAPITESLAKALAELAKNGDADLLSYLASILRERTKTSKDKDEKRGVLGLNPLQEVALRTLSHVDTPAANEQLLSLLFVADLDPRVRAIILKQLATDKPEFFPEKTRAWVLSELATKKSKVSAEELRYFQVALQIPSADLRKKSLRHSDEAFGDLAEKALSPSSIHRELCPSAPDNILLPLWKFTQGNEELLKQFNTLYKTTKASSERDALLFGIVNALSINKKTLKKVTDRLSELDLAAAGNAGELGAVLKTLSFLDTVERALGQSKEDTLTILDSRVASLAVLNGALKEVAVQKIKEVLPHEGINADAIQSLWEQWGNLEPIFVYAGKMAGSGHDGTLRLVAEMVAHMDAPTYEAWKDWRYNTRDKKVREQVGHLTEAQLEIWKEDHFAELGDIMIAATPSDKPKQIVRFIEGSLREGHVYNPEIDKNDRHKFIQEQLGRVYMAIAEQPDQREVILNGAAELLQADLKKIDAITRYSNLPKLEQAMTLFAEGKKVPVNAKTKNTLAFLAQFVPKEQFQAIEKAYKEAEKSGSTNIDTSSIISTALRVTLSGKGEEIKRDYEGAMTSDVFDTYGLNREQMKNVGQFYQKRQELKALLDLYRVSGLDVKRIATNRISDRVDKKGETLISVIDNLKTYFKDNPTFVQDIENIQSVISQREELGAKRRLAMIVTDNPQMVFQAGKYPLGCGSCQNYEGSPEWNKSLAGYVADAHTKVAHLIDLNKLPEKLRLEIEAKGFEQVKDGIPPQDLLEASIARSVTKLTKTADEKPALFIEPTYSSINKGDLTMDKYFNIFLELTASEPMGIRLVRGGGSETVSVPKSRNPSGQYEDCAAGNAGHAGMGIQTGSYTMSARFINKFTPVNDEDKKLAERISG